MHARIEKCITVATEMRSSPHRINPSPTAAVPTLLLEPMVMKKKFISLYLRKACTDAGIFFSKKIYWIFP